MARTCYLRVAISAALVSMAGAAFGQATTGNTQPADNNAARNLPGNAATASSPRTAPTPPEGTSTRTGGDLLASAEKKFMEKTAMHGMAEVEMGKLAQQKGASQQVKDFGARMEKDHGKANEELKSLAASKGVQLPASMDPEHHRKMEKMQKLSGAEFDRAYMKDMVEDHKKDVAEFRKQAKSAKDQDIKGFASKTLPTLEGHLQLAQQTDKAVRTAKK